MSGTWEENEVGRLLTEHKAVLVRSRKHKIYKFPDGRIYTISSTPGNSDAAKNQLRDLNHLLGLTKHTATVGDRRIKRTWRKPQKPAVAPMDKSLAPLPTMKAQLMATRTDAPKNLQQALEVIADLELKLTRITHQVNRSNLRQASLIAQIKMVEDQRDSWLPWWFRQATFKFLRRHFPLTRKFLKRFELDDYLSPQTQEQMKIAHKEDRQAARMEKA